MASDFENLDDLDWADVEGELEANRDAILAEAQNIEAPSDSESPAPAGPGCTSAPSVDSSETSGHAPHLGPRYSEISGEDLGGGPGGCTQART